MIILKFLSILLSAIYINCEFQCSNFETCGGCTTFPIEKCVWCSAEKLTGRRCQSLSFYEANKSWCKESVYNPWGKYIKPNITQNDKFTSGENGEKVVQFRPQYMVIKARPGVVINFTTEYKPAKDYPLDVYYLMDFSYTMLKHKNELEKQSMLMHRQLSNYTNNVQFGIGSFVEKPELPLSSPRKYTYSFKNHLSLTSEMKIFSDKINNSPFGANLDDPEAGFDALMQAMVCQNEIGWRNASRRVIVYCTDSTYHSAGDGKFVGAYKHNDMKCHLNKDGSYSEALSLDYPSVSQINKISTDNNVKIIFAVKENVRREYKALENKIRNAKYAELKQESNIVEIIVDAYQEMVGYVKIKRVVPSDIQLTLEPDCTMGNGCKVKHHDTVKINGYLKLQSCPSDKSSHIVRIGPVGLAEELVIGVDMDCQCDCEKPGAGEINSSLCSGAGTYQCGVCKCNKDRYGSECQCTGTSTDKKDLDKCKINKDDAAFCSGRGNCRCGKCEECQDETYGAFCEFDNNNDCRRSEGKSCAGNGRCHLGHCECDDGWSGEDCTCSTNNKGCIAVYSKEICTGNGVCECGKCVCNKLDSTNETYSGLYCESCKECAEKRCKELEAYVYCVYMNDKTYCDKQFNETSESTVLMLNATEIRDPKYKLAKWCKKEVDNEGFIVFRHDYKDTLQLLIQKEMELPPKANVWVVVGSAIGAILLIGLLTLLAWKILVDIHDAREYKKFSEESAAAGFDVSSNPLYQEPAANFSNPTYNSRC